MRELLGSANVPTDICFSFTVLMQRGGRIRTAGTSPFMKTKAAAPSNQDFWRELKGYPEVDALNGCIHKI